MRSTTQRPIAACLAALTVGAVASALLIAPPAFAQESFTEGVPPGSANSDIATDTAIADAVAEAAATGENVEIESLENADSEVYAAPDGTFVEEIAMEPFQAQLADGTWAPIDNTLIASADGTLVPTNSDTGLELSGGGDTVIARITDVHGRSMAYTWHEALPTPTVDGDTATYAEVIPGVDLKIRATNDGFAKVFEIKTPEAAASAEVATLELGIELDGFTAAVGETGALEILDYAGNAVYSGPTPMMWDATAPSESVGDDASDGWSPSTFARMAEVATAYTGGVLTLTPDQALLTDPEAVFPLRIDPRWVDVDRSHWALASSWGSYQDNNYYDGGSFEKSSSGTARLGRAWDDYVGDMEQTWRLAFEFPTSKFRGRQILDANLNMQMTYSWAHSCDGVTPSYGIYELEANLKRWTWDNNGDWGTKLATRDEGVWSGCNAPRDIVTDVTDYVADTAATGDRAIQFGLKVSDESACCNSFRRFGPEKTDSGSGGVSLSVKYNTPPSRPGSLTIDDQSCTSDSTVYLGAADSWTVSAKFADAEGDNMDGVLEWTDEDTGDTKSWTTSAADDERSSWTVDATEVSGAAYTATAAAQDTAGATGAKSGGCTVVIDRTPPEPPTVTSTEYPDDGNPHGSVGNTGEFTLASVSDDTAGYKWSLTDSDDNAVFIPETTAPVAVPGSATTILFDQPMSGFVYLSVRAFDAHGNHSAETVYEFMVGDASDPVSHWKLDEDEGTTAADVSYEYENDQDLPLTLDGPVWGGETAADAANDHVDYLTFDGEDDVATTTAPVIHTDESYTVSASVRLHQTDTDYTFVSQDGLVNSGFMLKYDSEDNAFLFIVCNQDSTQSGLMCKSTGTVDLDPQPEVWYTVTGVYDYAAGEIRLFVDGQLQVSTPVPAVFDATGSFVVGRDLYGGRQGTYFAGDIDEVKVWDRKLGTGEIERWGQRVEGIWDFESIDTAAYEDRSGRGNTLRGTDVEIVEGIDGQAMGLNGSSSTATASGVDLNTAGDFTIGAWVRLDGTDKGVYNIIGKDGDYVSPFYFGYMGTTTGRWTFRTTVADGTGYTWGDTVESPLPARIGEWTHLTVVYRAATEDATSETRLFVDGKRVASVHGIDLWAADGPLRIGSVWHTDKVKDHWPGVIDNVVVSTGAFDDQQVETLADPTARETSSRLATGDFDGDGDADALAIVRAADRNSALYVLEGNGTGAFTRTQDPVLVSNGSNGMDLIGDFRWYLDDAAWRSGDVNGDGCDDVVVAAPGRGKFQIAALTSVHGRCGVAGQDSTWFGYSTMAKRNLTAGDGWMLADTQVQVTDVTGDQADDIVLLRDDGLDAYSIWATSYSTGVCEESPVPGLPAECHNVFSEPERLADGTGDSRLVELAVGDFDSDWWGDVAEIRTDADGNAEVYIRYGSSAGLEAPVLALDTTGSWNTGRDHITVADVTGDGLPDLVNSYRFTSRVRIQVAESSPDRGGFTMEHWDYSARCTGCASDLTEWAHTRIAGGDIDGDGIDDLFTLRAGVDGDIGAMWTRRSTGSDFETPAPAWADPDTCFGVEGDVNGDGYRDAVVPYSSYDVDGVADSGAVWFVDGATGQASLIHQNATDVWGGAEAGDLFGFAVDTYDSNGDGCSDIAVGMPGENDSKGYVLVFPGDRNGYDPVGVEVFAQNYTGIPGAHEAGDQLGYSLAATNRPDGTPVLIIGIPGEDVQTDTTGAYRDGDDRIPEVVDGGAFVYIKGDTEAWVDQDTPGVGGGVEAGDQFGWSIAATPTRFIVGAPFEDGTDPDTDSGGTLVFDHETSAEGWPTYLAWLDQNDDALPGGAEAGDRVGYAVAAVDYWPEGGGSNQVETRFAIATPWEDVSGGTPDNVGVVTLVNLDSSGAYTLAMQYAQQEAGLGDVWEDYDHLGRTMALFDLDPTVQATNATLKLVIGVPDENYATGDDDGIVHITGAADPAEDIDTIVTAPSPAANDRFGTGFGALGEALYITAPGSGFYRFGWGDAAGGTSQAAEMMTP